MGSPLLRPLLFLLVWYKRTISPWLPKSCRFTPTCSEYARIALAEHGVCLGSLKTVGRLCRCQPFHPGGIDLP